MSVCFARPHGHISACIDLRLNIQPHFNILISAAILNLIKANTHTNSLYQPYNASVSL